MRSAYAWTVAQAAAGKGLKEMEQGLRERVMGVGAKLLQASLARGYGNGYAGGSIPCSGCAGRMRYVIERDKIITSWFQEIRLRRADGAAWIWNQAELTLPKNRVEIIDYYHASEKLWTVAKAIWGEEDAHGKKWAEHWSDKLYKGRLERVLGALRRLRGQMIGYFKTNRKRIRYGYFRRKGYFIGSGVTESSCKQLVGTRLKRARMHWDKQQAQAILQLRVARLNGRWDHLWN